MVKVVLVCTCVLLPCNLLYRKISNIRRTKSQNLSVPGLGMQLSFAQYMEAKC